jgi:hypothetical protein
MTTAKVLFMCGDHPRHRHIAGVLARSGALAGLVVEQRPAFVPTPPAGLPGCTRDLFVRHFRLREEAELRWFADRPLPSDVPALRIQRADLNGPEVRAFLARMPHRLLLTYGVHILDAGTLSSSPARHKWNIHGGLSPWYRGGITHFWPSYFLEPQMTGMTVHAMTERVDHGPMVHQTAAPMVRGDGLHDLACRAVAGLVADLPRLIAIDPAAIRTRAQNRGGRLWLAADWRPEHLHLIYDLYRDRIVDRCLDGEIRGREPVLYTQW